MMNVTNKNIGLKNLLEELRDLIFEMYDAKIKIKMEVATSGIKYDTTNLEKLDTDFRNHLDLLEQCVTKNDFVGIDNVVVKFRKDLLVAQIIALNLTITAIHSHDPILPVISSDMGEIIEKIDNNLVSGMENVGKCL